MSSLRRLRESLHLTQEVVAYRAGLHQTVISSLETGKRTNPSLDTLEKLAIGLGRPITDIVAALGRRRLARATLRRGKRVA